MALTYIETVRLLMGDLDEDNGDARKTGTFHRRPVGAPVRDASYDDENGDSKVSLVEVAVSKPCDPVRLPCRLTPGAQQET